MTAAEYEMTLEWQDKTNGNRGWTASLGRAPGFSEVRDSSDQAWARDFAG